MYFVYFHRYLTTFDVFPGTVILMSWAPTPDTLFNLKQSSFSFLQRFKETEVGKRKDEQAQAGAKE